MLKIFTKYVVGGRSGKREAAWALLMLWVAGVIWFASSSNPQNPMNGVQELLETTWPLIAMFMAAAYGMEWVSSQTKWGGRYDGDDYQPGE